MTIRRNALCPCQSGKRYKHCHGRLELSVRNVPQETLAALAEHHKREAERAGGTGEEPRAEAVAAVAGGIEPDLDRIAFDDPGHGVRHGASEIREQRLSPNVPRVVIAPLLTGNPDPCEQMPTQDLLVVIRLPMLRRCSLSAKPKPQRSATYFMSVAS